MELLPTGNAVANVAVPSPARVAEPSEVVPLMSVTAPVGMAVPDSPITDTVRCVGVDELKSVDDVTKLVVVATCGAATFSV